jgi:hypothetical protein
MWCSRNVVLADRLEEPVGADDVGLHERPRVVQGVVVVRLGREVDDGVGPGHQPVDQIGVGDAPVDEPDLVGDRSEVLHRTRVGQGVDHGDLPVRAGRPGALDEVGADEPCAAGDEHLHESFSLRSVGMPGDQDGMPGHRLVRGVRAPDD